MLPSRNVWRHIAWVFFIFLTIVLVGAAIIGSIEDWRYLDSFYFTVMTVTTTGYGDLVPKTDSGKVYTSLYSLVGIGTFFYMLALFTVQDFEGTHKKT